MSKPTRHIPSYEDASPSGLRRWQRSSFSRVGRAVVTVGALLAVVSCAGDDGPTDPGGNGEPQVPDAVPRAGAHQDVARGASITLSGAESSDPDGATLTYTWTQILGPDVTGGDGTLSGENVTVDAPIVVSTVVFMLEVDDGNGTGDIADTVQINVLEHTEGAFWVDGDAGNDTDGTGTRSNPYATISGALSHVDGANQDIYVKTRSGGAAYEEDSTLQVPTSISLYGGYDENWRRDAAGNRTLVHGAATVIEIGPVEDNAWVSGFRVVGSDATEAGEHAFGIRVVGGSGAITVEDNDVRSGSAENAATDGAAGSAYGVLVFGGELARVRRNAIQAGAGGSGADGNPGSPGTKARTDGAKGSNPGGGSGGEGGASGIRGGRGGGGGTGFIDSGARGSDGQGENGGSGGRGHSGRQWSQVALDGTGGGGGGGGAGGFPGAGQGRISDVGFFLPDAGTSGMEGQSGGGGGGGGGGASNTGIDGGGGGGGGGGGTQGRGGRGGGGGGASVGLLLHQVADAQVEDNEIASGAGGLGAAGGNAGIGGNGSKGGARGPRKCSIIGCGAKASGWGAHGGGGGKGGQGGSGGGGAGGPSYGILVGPGIAPTIQGNTVTSGAGGAGGDGGDGGFKGSDGHDGDSATRGGGSVSEQPQADSKPAGGGGFSYAVFDMDPDDGFEPALEDNTLTPGTGGEGGSGADTAHEGAVGESGPTNN